MASASVSPEETREVRKELTKHLQAAHLTLLAASVVVLLTSTLTPAVQVVRAFDQARSAERMDAVLTAAWLERQVRELGQTVTSGRAALAKTPNEVLGDYLLFSLNGRPVFGVKVTNPRWSPVYFDWGEWTGPMFVTEPPRTIEQFQDDWDLLIGAKAFVLLRHRVDFARAEFPASARKLGTWAIAAGTGKEKVCYLEAKSISVEQESNAHWINLGPWQSRPESSYAVCDQSLRSFDSWTRLPLSESQVSTVTIPFVASANQAASAEFLALPFREAMYDMARMAEGLESLRLHDFLIYVEKLKSEKSERVEVAGIQIPLATISAWGTLIILALQLYFLLHFRRFQMLGLHKNAELVTWIAQFTDLASRIAFQASVAILPPMAMAALAAQAYWTHSGWPGVAIPGTGALIGGYLALRTFQHAQSVLAEASESAG